MGTNVSLHWIFHIHVVFSHISRLSLCVIAFIPPGTEVFKKNVLRGFEHQVFVMHAVVRIHAVVSSVRKRRADWINVKHLKSSLTHGPGSVRVVELYTLGNKWVEEMESYLTVYIFVA